MSSCTAIAVYLFLGLTYSGYTQILTPFYYRSVFIFFLTMLLWPVVLIALSIKSTIQTFTEE